MRSYNFSLGNSTDSPVGYSARIRAGSPDEAVALLKEALSECCGTYWEYPIVFDVGGGAVEYIEAYFYPDVITVDDIDWVDDLDDPDPELND